MTAKLSKRFYDVLGEDVRQEEQRLADLRTELVRWMSAFWVTNSSASRGC